MGIKGREIDTKLKAEAVAGIPQYLRVDCIWLTLLFVSFVLTLLLFKNRIR